MPGLAYSSQAASARQSMSSGLSGDVRPLLNSHAKERSSTRSSTTAGSVFAQSERLFASQVAGNSSLARATPASVQEYSGVLPLQQAHQQAESVVKERRRQFKSSSLSSGSGSGLRHAMETVLEGQQQSLTSVVSTQVFAGVFLSAVAIAVLRSLQFAMAGAQTYASVVMTAHRGYNPGLTAFEYGVISPERRLIL